MESLSQVRIKMSRSLHSHTSANGQVNGFHSEARICVLRLPLMDMGHKPLFSQTEECDLALKWLNWMSPDKFFLEKIADAHEHVGKRRSPKQFYLGPKQHTRCRDWHYFNVQSPMFIGNASTLQKTSFQDLVF